MTLRVLVIGRGRLGTSVARALRAARASVVHWSGRGPWPVRRPAVDVALLAVADPFVSDVAARLAARLGRACVVLHASGAHGASLLDPLAPRARGVLHPLVSFAGAHAPRLERATAVAGGDARAVRAARSLGRALGLEVVVLPIHGPRYHAAAALVANGAAALATFAVHSLHAQGMPRRVAERAVGGLLRSVAENVATVGVPRALTGPIVRGDAAGVARHRAALDPPTRAAYDAIAPVILAVAREAGLPPARARAVGVALTRAARRPRSPAR